MTRLGAATLFLSLALTAGCGGAPRPAPTLGGQATQAAKPPTDKAKKAEHPTRWRDRIRNKRSIPELWTAINYHHDALGKALHAELKEPREVPPRRITRRPPRRRVTPRPGDVPVTPRRAQPPVSTGARRSTVCRRVCRHVQAICYAARRICRIATRLGEYPALVTCERARERCEDARRVARKRCTTCS